MEKMRISGGGPAGLSAAINLAQTGYMVEVFEKKSDVGGRFHGDLQGLENWSEKNDVLKSLKEMNIKINFDHYPFKELIITNGTKKWNFTCNKPAFYLVKRGSIPGTLDYGLKEQALNNGVDIHFNKTITPNQADIMATGPHTPEKFASAKGIFFKTNMKDMAMGLVNNKTAIKGYSYLLVAQKSAVMCTVLFDGFNNLNNCFKETYNTLSRLVDLDIQDPQKIGGIGCFSTQNIYQKDEKIYVGEAAGLQDLLWGFGIKLAIKSGFLAAKNITDGKDYDKTAHTVFDNKLKASLVNRFLWEKFGMNNYSFIVDRIYNARDPLKYLNWLHNYNFIQKMLYPFAIRYLRKRYGNLRL